MAKPKKQTREERLKNKRLAEKKRYERIRNNEELWKEKQEKNRLNYIRRKNEKKQLSIDEMKPREQRLQRKRWRKNYRAYYLRKIQEKRTAALLEENTPPQSPSVVSNTEPIACQDNIKDPPFRFQFSNKEPESPVAGPSRIMRSNSQQNNEFSTDLELNRLNIKSPSCSSPVSSTLRRIRYKSQKEINNLKRIIITMKKKNERYKKQLQRLVSSKTKNVPSALVISNRNRIVPMTKRIAKKSNKIPNQGLNYLPEFLKKVVDIFYEDDENSRLCSGKKEFIARNKIRKQKRYLSDSLRNLHKKFLKNSSCTISYSAFCKLRPFWVLLPDFRSRDTCLCKLHTNMDLIIQGLYQRKIITIKTPQDLLSLLCCDVYDENCLHRTCSACKNKVTCYQEFDNSIDITYWQWETKQDIIQSTARKIRTTEKVEKREEPRKCIEKFESKLNEYFMHCGNIVAQQKAFKCLKLDLKEGECIVHVDFSENYAVKCNKEIQSYHFGGSRKQLTLHTSVIYFLDDEKIQQVQSFCTVSECLRHDVSAVWAHIVPILEYLGERKTGINTIHFISDSPSSQYRNKKIFYLISSLHIYLSSLNTITWNYSESGHGKGAPDGVGAVMKRTADRAVSQGKDIKDLDDFLNIMEQNLKKVKLRTVSEYDVSEKDLLFPQNVKSFPGSMKMHQIVWNFDSTSLAVRKLSCTDDVCLYQPVICDHGKKHLGFYNLEDARKQNLSVTPLANAKRQLREIGGSFWHDGQGNIAPKKNKNTRKSTKTNYTGQEIEDEEIIFNIPKKPAINSKNTHKSLGISNSIDKEVVMTKKNEEKGVRKESAEESVALTEDASFGNISDITFSRDGNNQFSIDLENINPYLTDSSDEENFDIF